MDIKSKKEDLHGKTGPEIFAVFGVPQEEIDQLAKDYPLLDGEAILSGTVVRLLLSMAKVVAAQTVAIAALKAKVNP